MLGLLSMIFVIGFTFYTYHAADSNQGQSKRASLVEAWFNIVIGFSINYLANIWLIPLMTGTTLHWGANFWGGWVYTTISILRQYAIRRWFNERLHLFAVRLANKISNHA